MLFLLKNSMSITLAKALSDNVYLYKRETQTVEIAEADSFRKKGSCLATLSEMIRWSFPRLYSFPWVSDISMHLLKFAIRYATIIEYQFILLKICFQQIRFRYPLGCDAPAF